MDILQFGVPAVVLPTPTAVPNDQAMRARQFERLGRVAASVDDGPAQILRAVDAALQEPRSFQPWHLDGAERTAAWIRRQMDRGCRDIAALSRLTAIVHLAPGPHHCEAAA